MENEAHRLGEGRSSSRSRSRSTSAERRRWSRSRSRSTTPATPHPADHNTVTHNELTDANNDDLLEFVQADRAAEEQLPHINLTVEPLPLTTRDTVAEFQLPNTVPAEERLRVRGLSRISISEEHISDGNSISSSCPICLIDFQLGEEGVSQMRCGHIFHSICIYRWLQSGDSCPVCRRSFRFRDRCRLCGCLFHVRRRRRS